MASAGDVNGDGKGDVLVGVPLASGGVGEVQVYLGGCPGSGDADGDMVEDGCDACPGEDDRAYDADYDGVCAPVVGGGDCDDLDPTVFPGAPELCDGRDTTCAGFVPADELDADGDGQWICAGDLDEAGPVLTQAWTWEPDTWLARTGDAVAAAGDVNGDGFSDLALGAPGNLPWNGSAYVFLGSASGPGEAPDWYEVDLTSDEFGAAVASAGDVNGDGFDDVIIGDWSDTCCSANEGYVEVYVGSSSGLPEAPAWFTFGDYGWNLGFAVTAAGDHNNDGYDEVAVGAPAVDAVLVYAGRASGLGAVPLLGLTEPADGFGSALAAGDVNGDGAPDLIVGAPYLDDGELDEGGVYVYLGSPTGLVEAAAWTAEGDQVGANFGASIAVGDVNGDGFGDLVVGAPSFDGGQANEGQASLYLGSPVGLNATPAWTATSGVGGASFGASVGAAGDVNGDGFDDVVVGAPNENGPGVAEGRSFLYRGGPDGLEASPAWAFASHLPHAVLGASVAGAGDVNGDGFDDVLIGAPHEEDGQLDEGRVYLFYGRPSCALAGGSDDDGDAVPDDCDACPGLDDAAHDIDGDGACDTIDCDDTDSSSYPGAPERCDGRDNACAGSVPANEADGDGDGAFACADCDDADPSSYPGAPEACDGRDNACAGAVSLFEVDVDGDGAPACADCDDGEPTVYRGAVELCDGRDNVCAGSISPDEIDADGDGFFACADCNDADPTVFPGAVERCDGQDSACAGALPAEEVDADGDLYPACADCDDANPLTFPGAPERCDGEDNACVGFLPAGEDDRDGDGAPACADCADFDPTSFPGAPELCDGRDNACAGALPLNEVDRDGDGRLACAECDDTDPAFTSAVGCPDPEEERPGCGCAGAPSPVGPAGFSVLVAAAVLAVRRRRSGGVRVP